MNALLSALFSRPAARFSDERLGARKPVATAWPGFTAEINGAEHEVLDLSEGGLRVAGAGAESATIVIRQGAQEIRRGAAVRVWAAKGEAGYAFADRPAAPETAEDADAAPDETADACARLRARLRL